jgi:murein DD-endopeptidase MepM/ murein hydrolase activator NlpD
MDVFTFLQPENRTPTVRNSSTKGEIITFSFSALKEIPGAASFPVFFVLLVSLSLSITPLEQRFFGFYRLNRMSFPADTCAEDAMRGLVTPEPDASLIVEGSTPEIPLSIRTITYSTYKVRKGDSVSSIASRFGLHNISTILSANRIQSAKRVSVGQSLKIPSMDGVLYTVARGDSLARISSRYSVPVTAILDANDLVNETLLSGQQLFIPGATLSSMDLRRALGELFLYPIKGRLTSSFGYRADPFTGVRTFHTGIDLAAPTGTPIKATLDGRIATTGYSTVYGNYVIITHDDGYQSLYGHMSYIGVSRGQSVSQGQVIGKVGSTGYSTGSHCHFSLYKNGKMVNPLSLLK